MVLASASATEKYTADATGSSTGSGRSASTVDGQRRVQGQRPDGVAEAAVGQHRRVDAADQVAQLGQGEGGVFLGLGHQRERGLGVGWRTAVRPPAGSSDRDHPGLRAVVQVPLDAAELGGGGVDRVAAGLGEGLHPLGQLLGPGRELGIGRPR